MRAGALTVWSEEPLNAETPARLLCRSHLTPTELFFVRTHGPVPTVDRDAFRLTVAGEVHEPLVLSLEGLRERFPRTTLNATLACAGNRRSELRPLPDGIPWGVGAIGTATWAGARLGDVVRAAGIGPDARHVAFTGSR